MRTMTDVKIGIIGGSGLYQMPELPDVKEIEIETPFVRRQMLDPRHSGR